RSSCPVVQRRLNGTWPRTIAVVSPDDVPPVTTTTSTTRAAKAASAANARRPMSCGSVGPKPGLTGSVGTPPEGSGGGPLRREPDDLQPPLERLHGERARVADRR